MSETVQMKVACPRCEHKFPLRGEAVEMVRRAVEMVRRDSENDQRALELWNQLTPRHRQIVARLLMGDTNRQIGTVLGISEQVVKNYMREIYSRWDVESQRHTYLTVFMHPQLLELLRGEITTPGGPTF